MYQDKPKCNISVRILKIFVKNGIYIRPFAKDF